VSRLYFMDDADEMVRRRSKVPKGSVVEAWADVAGGGTYWVGEESKALLDAAGEPLVAQASLPEDSVHVFYGPQLTDVESLPREQSLRARVLSVHAIAVAWITLDGHGQRTSYEPKSPTDPVFHLRRPGGGAGHLWRRFETKREAIEYMRQAYGADSEGAAWAAALPAEDFTSLLRRYGGKPG
jgi:hypothetical protein